MSFIVRVTEGSNDGPPVPDPTVTLEDGYRVEPSGPGEVSVTPKVYLTVTAPGFSSFDRQPYDRDVVGPVTVSLQRRG